MKRDQLYKRVLDNLPLKITALIIALLLWFYVFSIKKSESVINIPIEIVNLPSSKMIVSPVPQHITVRMSGPRTLLFRLSSENFSYKIDASEMQAGTNIFYFTIEQLNLPAGIQPIWISPAYINVEIKDTMVKRLRVEAKINGEPKAGYSITKVDIRPHEVEIEGVKESLLGIEKIYTKGIDVNGESNNIKDIPVMLDLSNIKYKHVENDTVIVDIYIEPRYIIKTIHNFKVEVINAESDYQIFPEFVDIDISGPELLLETFPLKELRIYINIEAMPPGRYRVKPSVEAPDNIEVERISPDTVELLVSEKRE